jgi:hypothetical protein
MVAETTARHTRITKIGFCGRLVRQNLEITNNPHKPPTTALINGNARVRKTIQ